MKKLLKVLLWLVLLAAILVGGWQAMGWVREQKAGGQPGTAEASAREAQKVVVRAIQSGTISQSVRVTGEVRALQAVQIVPKIAGRLERLRLPDGALLDEGVAVEKGQELAVIEHAQLSAAVRLAETALEVAKAARDTAKVTAADALREKERWVRLRREGSGTEQQLDQATTAQERAEAQLKLAEAQVAQAEAALAQAKVHLDDAMVRAPFSGLITRKYVDEGAFVGPATPLVNLVDISQVETTGGVAGRHYAKLAVGKTRAIVEVDALPDTTFEGALTRVRPELDRVTRTVAVTICVPNPERKLKPGMYARIELVLDRREGVPVVPDEAIVLAGGKARVFVVQDGRARVRPIRVGLREGVLNEVVEGLRVGELVVVRGQQLLGDGMPVIPVEEASP